MFRNGWLSLYQITCGLGWPMIRTSRTIRSPSWTVRLSKACRIEGGERAAVWGRSRKIGASLPWMVTWQVDSACPIELTAVMRYSPLSFSFSQRSFTNVHNCPSNVNVNSRLLFNGVLLQYQMIWTCKEHVVEWKRNERCRGEILLQVRGVHWWRRAISIFVLRWRWCRGAVERRQAYTVYPTFPIHCNDEIEKRWTIISLSPFTHGVRQKNSSTVNWVNDRASPNSESQRYTNPYLLEMLLWSIAPYNRLLWQPRWLRKDDEEDRS